MENSELILKALKYIKDDFQNTEMSVESVAYNAGFSTDYFNRIFTAHTGFNVKEYVRFIRLRQATVRLRLTNDSILDIALGCGYDSHESFSRAFKNQYGKTPSEFRESMKSTELLYGDCHNETLCARLLHEFTNLKAADSDEAIDYLLESNAVKYGYMAICCKTNGGVALYAENSLDDGFIWATEWDGIISIDIISENYDVIAMYYKMFSDDKFNISVYLTDDTKTVNHEFSTRGLKAPIKHYNQAIYRGKKYDISAPNGISIRELTFADCKYLESFFIELEGSLSKGRKRYLENLYNSLKAKYEHGNSEHSIFIFGMFMDEHMIAMSGAGLQRVHGFVLNNCIDTTFIKGYESTELYKYAYKYITNESITAGAVPFDDIQCNDGQYKSGNFNSTELGYEIVQKRWVFH